MKSELIFIEEESEGKYELGRNEEIGYIFYKNEIGYVAECYLYTDHGDKVSFSNKIVSDFIESGLNEFEIVQLLTVIKSGFINLEHSEHLSQNDIHYSDIYIMDEQKVKNVISYLLLKYEYDKILDYFIYASDYVKVLYFTKLEEKDTIELIKNDLDTFELIKDEILEEDEYVNHSGKKLKKGIDWV